MEKVVFLDRDGVINNPHEHYYVHRIEDFDINTGMVEGLQALQAKGYKFVLISNQGGISKGEFSVEDVELLHLHMKAEFKQHGIDFLAIYYCPHHDSIEKCLCRKPEPLMLEKAIARFGIDREQSYFIGDKQSDIDAGLAAGVDSILIDKNQDIREVLHKIR